MTNVPLTTLIARAYRGLRPADMVGLPEWARNERYDVSATSTLRQATADDRVAMMRAMLENRFKLAMHFEKREQPAYDLVVALSDGKLGSGACAHRTLTARRRLPLSARPFKAEALRRCPFRTSRASRLARCAASGAVPIRVTGWQEKRRWLRSRCSCGRPPAGRRGQDRVA